MKLRVLVLSGCRDLRDFAGRKKLGLIPEDIRNRAYFNGRNVDLQAMHLRDSGDAAAVESVVHELVESLDGILILCETRLVESVGHLAASCFFCCFDEIDSPGQFGNLLGRALSRSMKNFEAFSRRFDDHKFQKIFILPSSNFSCPEFRDLKQSFSAGAIGVGFPERLEEALKAMRKRQRPKIQRSEASVYFVDDRDLFFEYGKERHARFSTGVPHGLLCAINGHFRFGRRFDTLRHFNVSREGKALTHAFTDCHGGLHAVVDKTHANVFPNDFVA